MESLSAAALAESSFGRAAQYLSGSQGTPPPDDVAALFDRSPAREVASAQRCLRQERLLALGGQPMWKDPCRRVESIMPPARARVPNLAKRRALTVSTAPITSVISARLQRAAGRAPLPVAAPAPATPYVSSCNCQPTNQ